jgi:hypothetical protein
MHNKGGIGNLLGIVRAFPLSDREIQPGATKVIAQQK